MFVTVMVSLFIIVSVFIDLVPIYQKQEWMAFFLYLTLLAFAFVIAVLLDLNVSIPSPANFIKGIVFFFLG